jgi:uncharacterized protein (DUF3084 family)
LLAACNKSQAQLQRYKQRLSDVVQAYKSLQKEKQALETSLHAITPTLPDGEGQVRTGRACCVCTARASL